MNLEQRGYSMLIVSSSQSFVSALENLLSRELYSNLKTVSDINSAKQVLSQIHFDFIVINLPYNNESAQFAIDLSNEKESIVLYLSKSEIFEEIQDKLTPWGIFNLSLPTNKATVSTALGWMISAREKVRKFEKKSLSVQQKMEEIRIVNRAKWILITRLNLTEPQAHRYIEKNAMDLCVTRREIAENIIKENA